MSVVKENLKKVSKVFKKKNNTSQKGEGKDSIPDPEYDLPDFTKLFEDFKGVDIEGGVAQTKDSESALSMIGNVGEHFRELGFKDGILLGAEGEAIKSIVRNAAFKIQAYIESRFLSKRDEIRSRLQEIEFSIQQSQDELDSNQSYFNKLQQAKRWLPKSYSFLLSCFYIISGLVLIAADFGISLDTLSQGFLIQNELEKYLIAFGIAFSTAYIKIYFDLYLLPTIEKSVTTFKKANLPGIDDDPKDIKKVKQVWNTRFIFNSFIFLICIVMFYVLAEFRYFTLKTMQEEALGAQIGQFLSVGRISFVTLSLMFPVIGGICMAMGINKFINIIIFFNAKWDFERSKKRINRKKKKLSLWKQRLDSFENYVRWCNRDGDFLKEMAEYFYAIYRHGYEYGFQKRTKDMDLFKRSKELRKQFAARNVRILIPSLKLNLTN